MPNQLTAVAKWKNTLINGGKSFLAFLLVLFISIPFTGISQINFGASNLQGEFLDDPTSLDFGPDGRLYVTEQFGDIYAYTIARNGLKNYQVTSTEHITLVKNIQNFNDDGTLYNPTVKQREVTGILAVGTSANPVLYVSSSDYRIGGGGGGSDQGLCTNSGIISRLTWNGSSWDKVDLVRGLPRSEENHATNGMQLDKANNILYVAQGGHTNAGAPSNKFAFTTEYALAAAILTIDLDAIDALAVNFDPVTNSNYVYDLPTVDDPTRANANGVEHPDSAGYDGIDVNDPFGGNDGLNQAKLVIGGPVQIYSPGYRNIYDLVLTKKGRLYTWDNGPNGTWGGHPDNEGSPNVTNNWVVGEPGSDSPGPNDAKVNNKDGLHFVTGSGYYGGHPNPIRANPVGAGLFTHDHNDGNGGANGVWRTSYDFNDPSNSLPYDWPPLDPSLANPIEADYQNPGVDDQSLFTITASTNGMCEYTASNFDSAMTGDVLAVSWNENLYHIQLNAAGSIDGPSDVVSLGKNFGSDPLDVTAQGDSAIFPGTIWVASYGSDNISILEPLDFIECSAVDSLVDEDFDGFANSDEIDNASDPCNGSNLPPDFDGSLIGGFKVSNLNDPDDDDDGLIDLVDPFVWDATNGSSLALPFNYSLLNGDPGTGFYGLGFTGLMSNGTTDYLDLIQDEDNSATELIAGGAVGLLTFNNVAEGHPFGTQNDLKNGFQFGISVDASTEEFRIDTRLIGPIFDNNPQGDQFHGFYIGTGDQDNFLMMTLDANNGTPQIRIIEELGGVDSVWTVPAPNLISASEISFQMVIDPATGEVQTRVDSGAGNYDVGPLFTLRGALLNALQSSDVLAIGVTAGRSAGTPAFSATWDFIKAEYLNNPLGNWSYLQNGVTCNAFGSVGSCPEGRHEASYVQVGDKFVLLGGKEAGSGVNIYDPTTRIWTQGAFPGFNIHHFQAVEYQGLIYMFTGMNGKFPNEVGLPNIWIYDVIADEWIQGPPMPASRIRGSAGCVIYNQKFYLISGIVNGHSSGWVPWVDMFDPATNTWSQLADAPHSRDHFQAAVVNDKIYAAGGRRSGSMGTFNDTEADVDVYDISTNTWTTLPNPIPTERAGTAVAVLSEEILIIGGEKESGAAKNVTEALNTATGNWRSLSNLNTGRHGTQAIVNNSGVYIAAGSGNRGAGQLPSHEVFFLGAQQPPILNPVTPSTLTSSISTLKFPIVNGGDSATKVLTFLNTGGNQGIILKAVSLDDGAGLSIETEYDLPFHLSPGQTFEVSVTYKPGVTGIPNDLLTIDHNGAAPFTQILISDPSCPVVDLGADFPACANQQLTFTAGTFLDSAVWYVNDVMVASDVNIFNHTTTGNDVVRVELFPDSASCPVVFDTINLIHSVADVVSTNGSVLMNLTDGAVLDKKALGNFGLLANPCPTEAESVIFNLDGVDVKTESTPPYSINGDQNGFINPWSISTGNHVLIIKAFSQNGGNGTPYPPDTFNISVVDSIIGSPVDCNGDTNGTASVDACGICTGGATGLTPNASCSDCNGTPNGSAAVDACGICAGGITGVTPDASCTDCNGDVNGTALVDACGVCAGGNTGLIADASCTDCNGDLNGTAVTNGCGVCVLGNTGNAFDFNCNLDCNGDLNGTAALDACGVCAGGNTGVVTDASCTDCFGVVNGTASVDACGICTGGTTGLVANASCLDCNGDPNGTAALDTCGVCSGGNTGIAVNSTCGGSCVPNEVVSFTLIQAGGGGVPIRELVDGDVLYKDQLGNFSVRADICNDGTVGSVIFNLNGNNIRTENSAPYAINGDNSNGYRTWNVAVGSYTLIGTPSSGANGSGVTGIAKTVSFSVIAVTPQFDCNGDVGGNALVDACGVCAGGNTGNIPNASCSDCNGTPNGTAAVDACGICAGGTTGVTPDASCTDCNGDVNGTALVDACGVCAGGNTGVIADASCTDCNGDINGTAVTNGCGICVLGNTGNAFDFNCNLDCNGDLNGTAAIDACGVCAGGNTGVVADASCTDCFGVVNGTASIDACGICTGGTTGLVANASCADCNGVPNGTAALDTCGVCSGGNTGIAVNSTCGAGNCVPNEVVSFTLMQAGSGGQPIRKIFNGDILYKDQLGNFSLRADICNDGTVGSVVFNLNGSDIRTENIAPYSINGDNSNNGFSTWNVAAGSYTLIATPSTNSNGNGTLGVVETVTFSVVDIKPSQDCNGDAGGSALVDACGVCAGGNTGNIPNASCNDCNGTPNGTAAVDACGICAGGTTGVTPDVSCTDCNGDVNGSATVDACGVCAGGNTGVIANTSCTDCNGVVNGTAVTNACGICVLGNTGNAFDFNCNVDCNGDLNGTAALDACGVCAGGNTGVVADASCTDCFGVVNGSASIDACGICTGGTTGLVANASCADCNGVPNGTAALDTCGVCSGGNTGIAVNSTCGGTACVPVEVVTLMLIDATTNQDLRPLVNGDVINLTALPNFSVRADVCSDPDVESVEFDLNGTEIATQNVPPYSVTGDNNGVFTPWALAVGTYTLEAIPFPKNWGNGPAGVSKQVTFQVLNGPPPPDCDGVAGGSAAIDACGVCAGGTTGIVPGSSCSDCNGTPNGTAAVDACGICAGGTTGVTPDVSCTDCNGDVNGTALVDACGICAGGNTGVIADASCTDCNGDINGTAVTNGCGICVLGNTGNAFDFNCNVDCNGDLNGTATLDACGVCAGGNTGVVADASCTDCFGVVNGSASIDACGICTGGTTGLVANASCADCNGVPNGTAALDTCGVCSGGNTGIAVNSTCGGTACVPVEVVTLMLIDATTNQDLRPLVNGDVINLTALPNFSVRADVCSDPDVESVEFDLNGTEIATQNVPPYSVTGDNNGVFTPWALAVGTYTLEAIPFPKNWGNGPAGVSKQVTFQVLNGPPPPDCDGVAGGSAAIDACGVCAGGTTGIVPGSSCSDCNGTPNGTAAVDACGICAGGTTGVTPDVSCTDCNGDVNGTALVDACGICAGGNTGVIADASCTDCNGVVNGTAITNACGICVLGNTGNPANFNCNIDCNGDLNGTAALDACGVCAGGNTGVVADASCTDCFGVVNGSASIDACGICTGGTTGLVANASCADCNGVPNGTAAIDTCGVCSGGNTGIAVNSTCGGGSCVPNEVVTLMLIDASNGQDIGPMANGDTIDLSVLTDFSVRAEVCSDPDVESVVFSLNSNNIRTESVPPYSVNGDNNGNYSPWGLAAGSYTLVGTPYSGNGGGGNAGVAKSVSFHVVDGPPPPPVFDCNGVLGGSAYVDACGNCVGGNTGQSPCTPPAGCDEFIEVNGLVVVEVESEPKANGSWYEGTGSINGLNPVGASGSYYMWRANCVSGSDPNWVYSGCGGTNGGSDANAMTYEVFISNPGRYRFRMRSWQPNIKLGTHSASTENNDFWLQLPDGGGIKKKGGTEIPIGNSEWVKIYQNSPANWVWGSKTVDNNPHDVYVDFPTIGSYTVKIGGRSKLMALDRFVLYRQDNPTNNLTDAQATTDMPTESQRGPCVSSAGDNTGNTVNGQPGVQSEQTQSATTSLGNDELHTPSLSIKAYPNPTTGMLQLGIVPADAEAFIELYDATGKLLLSRPQEGEEQSLDLSSYPNGIYMLKIRTADQVKMERIYKE